MVWAPRRVSRPPGPRRALGPGPCRGPWHAAREGRPGPQSGGGVEIWSWGPTVETDIYLGRGGRGYLWGPHHHTPHRRYILTPRGPKRASDAYRPGWEGGQRWEKAPAPGGFFRHTRFSTYPVFDIPGFRHTRFSTYPSLSTYPNSPVGDGPKSSTPLPRALCPRALSARGRPSYACQRARGGCAHDAVADVADVADGLGGWSREIGRILTKSLKWRFRSPRLAHFVWEKCRARTTYIVKGCPRKTFWTL